MKRIKFEVRIYSLLIGALLATLGVSRLAFGLTVDGNITANDDADWTVANNLATNAADLGVGHNGVQLIKGSGLAICVSAPAGQTVTSGTMRAYVYMPVDVGATVTYRWLKYPALDWVLAASVRDQCSGDKEVLSGIGRFAYVEDDAVLSGGTTLKVTYSMRERK